MARCLAADFCLAESFVCFAFFGGGRCQGALRLRFATAVMQQGVRLRRATLNIPGAIAL